jgi:DNA-binding response OmpR family regulator
VNAAPEKDRPLVLVAEDEHDLRALVSNTLEDAGLEVMAASDGAEALRLALDRRPDLAVLDVRMPKLSGLDVTTRIREIGDLAQTPVLLLTAATEKEDVARGFEAGAHGYLEKPFSPFELVARVEALLAERS